MENFFHTLYEWKNLLGAKMINLEVVIGIEIHLELNTKSKMFSNSPNFYDAKPNENINEIDLGYPGTLPTVNKEAVFKGLLLAKALKMKIDTKLRFDRKNYFYPDLTKGYQITQQFFPIGKNGVLPIENKNISIERIHLEEDTAKQIHGTTKTSLNYNRAGVPLIELVTDPVISTAEEAAQYVQGIRNLAIALNISDVKMEEGSLRADVNISLRPFGALELGTKVEIKNINSISNMKKAISFEISRQTKLLLTNKKIEMETRRFNDKNQETAAMRKKNDSIDYKYFPEPNIPIITLDKSFLDKAILPILP
jgi:aspartyl-tRNA(Asn)/glutamyl-tRNA(Gln) amidotransferase subunit B